MYPSTNISGSSERSNYHCAQSIAHVIQLLRSRPMPTKVGEASVTSRLALLNGGIDKLSFDAMKSPGRFTVRVFASSAPPPPPTPSSASLHKRGSSLSSSQPSYIVRRSSGAHYTGRSSSGLHSPPPLPEATPPDPEEDIFDMDPDSSLLLETWTFESSTYSGDSRSVLDIAQEATLARVICSYCTMHSLPETPFRKITVRSGDANANETDGDKWLTKKWNMKNNSRECLAVTRRYPAKHGILPQSCIDGSQPPSATPTGRKFNADGSTASADDGNSPPVSTTRGRERGLSRISPPCGPTSVGRLTNASFANSRHTSPPLHPTTFTTGSSGSTQYITPFELPPGSAAAATTHSRTNSGNCGIVGGSVGGGSVLSAGYHHTGSLVNSFDGGMHNHAMGSLTRNTATTRHSSGNSPYERGTSTPNITLQISALAEKIQHSLRNNKPAAIDVEEEFKNLQMQAPLQRLH